MKGILGSALLLLSANVAAAGLAYPSKESRRAIRDAQQVARSAGERVWPGLGKIPFDILLIEADRETLFCSPLRAEFKRRRRDSITGCTMQLGPRKHDPELMASFPIFDEREIIAAHAVPATPNERMRWISLVQHEHFHQLQTQQPGYYEKVAAIGLQGSQNDGMWMLNYAFPYADPKVGAAFDALLDAAIALTESTSEAERQQSAARYLAARAIAEQSVLPRDWRYYEFQIWQEGVARWTEGAILREVSGANLKSSWPAMLNDWQRSRIVSLKSVRKTGLKTWKRSAFYELGVVEANIAQSRCRDWKSSYWLKSFTMKPLLSGPC